MMCISVLPLKSIHLALIRRTLLLLSTMVCFPTLSSFLLTRYPGPYNFLRAISDQFTAAGAKATFFFNGNNFDCIYNANRVADVQYAYAAGHMVASHTWSHADLTTLTSAQLVDSMYRSEEFLSRIVGVRPAFMRPPFGSYNQEVQTVSADRGQSLALWDYDTGDADGNTPAQSKAIYDSVINNNAINALILEHETLGTTANTLVPYAINLFKSKGYKLVTLAECLGVDAYQAVGIPQQRTVSLPLPATSLLSILTSQ
ncbi:carbohydrate esterase family 4 protein [Mycena pura]|uniref:Carbohydrate esterase family 4 protein n=1 Tax=Mycena pura TaxID=153505 RepID=A0AAD6UTW7_9AGAR|nr:carbohydrate esterase family 4 protein [Mycena pura]